MADETQFPDMRENNDAHAGPEQSWWDRSLHSLGKFLDSRVRPDLPPVRERYAGLLALKALFDGVAAKDARALEIYKKIDPDLASGDPGALDRTLIMENFLRKAGEMGQEAVLRHLVELGITETTLEFIQTNETGDLLKAFDRLDPLEKILHTYTSTVARFPDSAPLFGFLADMFENDEEAWTFYRELAADLPGPDRQLMRPGPQAAETLRELGSMARSLGREEFTLRVAGPLGIPEEQIEHFYTWERGVDSLLTFVRPQTRAYDRREREEAAWEEENSDLFRGARDITLGRQFPKVSKALDIGQFVITWREEIGKALEGERSFWETPIERMFPTPEDREFFKKLLLLHDDETSERQSVDAQPGFFWDANDYVHFLDESVRHLGAAGQEDPALLADLSAAADRPGLAATFAAPPPVSAAQPSAAARDAADVPGPSAETSPGTGWGLMAEVRALVDANNMAVNA